MKNRPQSARLGFEQLESREMFAAWNGDEGFSQYLNDKIPQYGSALTTVLVKTINDLAPGDEVRVKASLATGPRPPGPTTLTAGLNAQQSGLISITGTTSSVKTFTTTRNVEQVGIRAGNYDSDDSASVRVDVRRQPDLAAVKLGYRADGQGVAFDVTVRRNFLPENVSVALFWNDDRSGNVVMKEAWRGTLLKGTRQDQVVSFSLPSSWLSSAPAGATRLIAVVDPDARLKEPNETNNRAEIRLTPLNLTNTLGSTSGTRGAITNGKFAPPGIQKGEDTGYRDLPAAAGRLTPAEQQAHVQTFSDFLRGKSTLNSLIGKPVGSERTNIIDPFITRFLAGTGGTVDYLPGNPLSNLVRSSTSFQGLSSRLSTHIQQQLASQAANGNVNFGSLNIATFLADRQNTINYSPQDTSVPFTLRAVLGGTQALRVTITMQSVSPSISLLGGNVRYVALVRYEIFDVFGAGNNDRYVPPLEAMWQLQHRGSQAKPFNNRVVVEETITGQFAVPSRFNAYTVK